MSFVRAADGPRAHNDAAGLPLLRTPLYSLHAELGAVFVPFAGYEMPVQFRAGILAEHRQTRTAAGLFDISHMGQICVHPGDAKVATAADILERLMPQDISALPAGRQRYAVLTNEAGGIIDDLMVANRGDRFHLIVNAACRNGDERYLRNAIGDALGVELQAHRALLALQGPRAEEVIARLSHDAASMRFMDVRDISIAGIDCVVSRSGYTGEDGYEIGVDAADAIALAQRLLADPLVAPAGLGARDTLRLEAGLCLYGSDIDATTTPVEAALDWSIQKSRRAGGIRAGGFPGANVILAQLQTGAARRRVGLRGEGRIPVRAGGKVFAAEHETNPLGAVTSGSFSPTLQCPIAMALVDSSAAALGSSVFVEVRGRRMPMQVTKLPFVPARYKRDA